ncbi:FAD/NAD(P)-binding protein [Pyxidicoccus trucidator]|uniref:FAD/NAD(P)-binding protein n=1 Tax=Pyxidicoccus trucidator TaxID=2709662 RepID=UPI0013DAE20C|nr:FAD/NAD(P)-binding protein [Pyxidicoccus trucidator]
MATVDPRVEVRETLVIIGGGPAAMYLLKALARLCADSIPFLPASILVVEAGAELGVGMPYHADLNLPIHNLAANQGVSRLDKGQQLRAELHQHVAELRGAGVDVQLRPGTRVTDMERHPDGTFTLSLSDGTHVPADFAILASGHWETRSERLHPSRYLPSCWPAAALQQAVSPGEHIALLGASLTATDAVVSVAVAHGAFERHGGVLHYVPGHARPPTFTMMARGGWLPKVAGHGISLGFGDPLGSQHYDHHFTWETLEQLATEQDGFIRLDQVHALLVMDLRESGALSQADARGWAGEPDAASALDALACTLGDGRGLSRFERDFREASASFAQQRFIPWQALLWQKTEMFRDCYALYPGEDRELLDRHGTLALAYLRPMNLANAERLIALRRAGLLSLLRLGEDYRIDDDGGRPRVQFSSVTGDRRTVSADLLVQATGQRPNAEEAEDPLLRNLFKRGLLHPRLVPFLEPDLARAALEDPRRAPRIVERGGSYFYNAGGVHIDLATCEIPVGGPFGEPAEPPPGPCGFFTLGPPTLGAYPLSDGLHTLARITPRIVGEISSRIGRQRMAQLTRLLEEDGRATAAQRKPA